MVKSNSPAPLTENLCLEEEGASYSHMWRYIKKITNSVTIKMFIRIPRAA